MESRLVEIVCTECGADTLVRREAKVEGFKKVGELFFCSSCGHEFASEAEVPFKQRKKLAVFSDADRSKKIEVFREADKGHTCRVCEHYTVNPFTQRCGLNNRIVQAADTCPKFEEKKEKKSAGAPKAKLPGEV